jgi:hypothetical protein
MTDESESVVHPLIAFEQHPDNRVSVTEDLEVTEPLVLKTQRLLHKAKRDTNGLASVSPASTASTRRSMTQRSLFQVWRTSSPTAILYAEWR